MSDQSVDPVFSGWLGCVERGCETPLPLFSLVSIPIEDEERRKELSTWQWDGLKCPSGHSIEKPDMPFI